MKKVETAYNMFYELWNITMIPKLMRMHKWFDGKAELQNGDIVYFRKQESELSSKWTVGKVTDIVKSKDGITSLGVFLSIKQEIVSLLYMSTM